MEEHGVKIDRVVNTGGLSIKNATLMQIYADILGRPLQVAASEQTCALGAAFFGAVCGGSVTLEEVQRNCCRMRDIEYRPIPENEAVYREIYALYLTLHDAFGVSGWQGRLDHVMKELIAIRQRQRS
jgi:L-ribulokinase